MQNNTKMPDLHDGDTVVMVNCYEAEKHGEKRWKVRGKPWQLGHGVWVVKLEGKAGSFACDKLRKVNEEVQDDV